MKPSYIRPEIKRGPPESIDCVGDILGEVDGSIDWLSNVKREDVSTALRELITVNDGTA